AEVFEIVREQPPVLLDLFGQLTRFHVRQLQLAWCGGQPDLNCLLVVVENNKPFAPRGAVAFVYHDYVEISGRVVLEEKGRVNFWLVWFVIIGTGRLITERLISGNQDPRILLGAAGINFSSIVAECGLEISKPI